MPCKARQNSVTDNEVNIMSQCISFNALGPVPRAKIVFRGHLYVCLSAYQDTSWIAFFYVVFALHRGLKTAKHSHHQIMQTLPVCFVQIRMSSMVVVTRSAFLG